MLIIRLIFLIAIIVAAVSMVAAQEGHSLCPTIEVIGPAGITQPRDELTFVANVVGTGLDIRYEWAAEAGKIVKGQGTAAITVTGDEPNTTVKATVTIFGLPKACANIASESAGIAPVPEICSLDEWGKLDPNDERGRVDAFFHELSINPTSKGIFVFVGVPATKRTVGHQKIEFIARHAKFRNFDMSRLTFLFETDGSIDANVVRTILYRIPPDAELPYPGSVVIDGAQLRTKALK